MVFIIFLYTTYNSDIDNLLEYLFFMNVSKLLLPFETQTVKLLNEYSREILYVMLDIVLTEFKYADTI